MGRWTIGSSWRWPRLGRPNEEHKEKEGWPELLRRSRTLRPDDGPDRVAPKEHPRPWRVECDPSKTPARTRLATSRSTSGATMRILTPALLLLLAAGPVASPTPAAIPKQTTY